MLDEIPVLGCRVCDKKLVNEQAYFCSEKHRNDFNQRWKESEPARKKAALEMRREMELLAEREK